MTDLPPGFQEFWDQCARKAGKDQAIKTFAKFPISSHPAIMDGLEMSKQEWIEEGREKKHIPYPSTYLNSLDWQISAEERVCRLVPKIKQPKDWTVEEWRQKYPPCEFSSHYIRSHYNLREVPDEIKREYGLQSRGALG